MRRSELLLFIRFQLQKAARFISCIIGIFLESLPSITIILNVLTMCAAITIDIAIQVMEGKAYCVIHRQGLFTIDIDGQMDEQVGMEHSHRSLEFRNF